MKSVSKYDRKTRNHSILQNLISLLRKAFLCRFTPKICFPNCLSLRGSAGWPRHLGRWPLPVDLNESSFPFTETGLTPSVATYFHSWDPLSPDFPFSLSKNHSNSLQASTSPLALCHSCRSKNTCAPHVLSDRPPLSLPVRGHPRSNVPLLFLKSCWSY